MDVSLPSHSYLNLCVKLVVFLSHDTDLSNNNFETINEDLKCKNLHEGIIVFPHSDIRKLKFIIDICNKFQSLGVVSFNVSQSSGNTINIGMLVHPLMGVYGLQWQSHLFNCLEQQLKAEDIQRISEVFVKQNGLDDNRIEIAKDKPKVFPSFLGLKLGMLINDDVYFPENARLLGLSGADLVIAINNMEEDSNDDWLLELRGHAIFNGFYICGLHLAAKFGKYLHAVIVSPEGLIVSSSQFDKNSISGNISIKSKFIAQGTTEVYRQRKPEAYKIITNL